MKRLFALALCLSCLLCTMISCKKEETYDPFAVAKYLDNEEGQVALAVDSDDIEEIFERMELSSDGVYCIMTASPEDEETIKHGAFIFFCESEEDATSLKEDLDLINDESDFLKDTFVRRVIEQSGNLVVVGCNDVWRLLQQYEP